MENTELNEQKFWNKISKYSQKAGIKLIYVILLLYYAFKKKYTPLWAKTAILGSITYFLSPLDFIPDLTPFFGFTDDLAILMGSLIAVASQIDVEVKNRAKTKLSMWFDEELSPDLVEEIDNKINKN